MNTHAPGFHARAFTEVSYLLHASIIYFFDASIRVFLSSLEISFTFARAMLSTIEVSTDPEVKVASNIQNRAKNATATSITAVVTVIVSFRFRLTLTSKPLPTEHHTQF
jgi:hypothetical protein